MNRAYIVYCRIAAVIFIVNTIYPVTMKLLQHRLSHDWLHSLLHLICALLGLHAGWRAKGPLPARTFTWCIGALYFGLGVYGWFTPGLFLHSPLAIPLGTADNVFHILVSLPALIIVVLESRAARGTIAISATME